MKLTFGKVLTFSGIQNNLVLKMLIIEFILCQTLELELNCINNFLF